MRNCFLMKLILGVVLIGLLGGCTVYMRPGHRAHTRWRHPVYTTQPGHRSVPPGHGGIPPGQAKKMGPPPVAIVGVPTFTMVPGTNVRVMRGVDADVFLVHGVYYRFHKGGWYKAKHHGGPWKAIAASDLPPGLVGKSPKALKVQVKGRGGAKGRK